MVELGNNLSEHARWLIDFVRATGGAVLASNSGTGCPESAYVNVAATDSGRIVLGTNTASRKFSNVTSDPRVSLVIMQGRTEEVQLEGEARVLEDSEAAAAGEVLEAQHPGATDTHDPENLRILEITVRWGLHTDVTQRPPLMEELTLR
ncbi:pyridoxamine 5'-phosphate oxidase family protein [Kocuria tytonis]|uniref:Pyridoxamine 5'-phosphate oxidase family protein n=1 Tax=Kocuria tytonis TaxID=2054280 RepID=A0A495ACC0_9MICC|nr:pyridoxamine 5'-phosphate oxidase family protein [Kocuria tytonis]RKQ36305.1 pyridoxamine 5'-phosphate oxidase family protein [Kocuria tytonis]